MMRVCTGRPVTRTANQTTPALALTSMSSSGSGQITASARYPRTEVASVPLPVLSSSTTDCTWTVAASSKPERLMASSANILAARPPFMSADAAAIHPAVTDHGIERGIRPHVDRAGRHDIDVCVHDQRAAGRRRWPMGPNDVPRIVVGNRDRREAGMVLDVVLGDAPTVHRVAARGERVEDIILDRMLGAAHRRKADEILRKADLLVKSAIDLIENALLVGGHGAHESYPFLYCRAVILAGGRRRVEGTCRSPATVDSEVRGSHRQRGGKQM